VKDESYYILPHGEEGFKGLKDNGQDGRKARAVFVRIELQQKV